jgi:AcrR family transcriptional regulator
MEGSAEMAASQPQTQSARSRPATPRERARAATTQEAKTIALRQLADGGIEAISLKAIALELGLTGPAIYRYFASRTDLLTELILDAYNDLGRSLDAAVKAMTIRSASARVHALADAYRAWALAQPHRYRLLFSAPVPGYDANAPRLVDAADRSMATLLDLYPPGGTQPTGEKLPEALTGQLRDWALRHERDPSDPDALYRGVITWTRLHGFVSLEIEGAFASMGIDADTVFRREVDALATG